MNTTANKTPWHADDCPDAQGFVTIRPDDGHGEPELDAEPIATVYEASHAVLIAAAPEMLEALKAVIADCHEQQIALGDGTIYAKAEAAIAKATGNA